MIALVAPIAYDEPIRQVAHDIDSSVAASLITLSLTPDPNEKLPGRPLTLMAAMSHADDRGQQLTVIKAYWRLSAELPNTAGQSKRLPSWRKHKVAM